MTESASTNSSLLPTPHSPLVFDAVGTLIYAEPSPAEVYDRVGRRFGSRLSTNEIGRRFRSAFAAEEAVDRRELELRTDEARERRRWQTIVATVLDDVTDQAAAFDELWRRFAQPDAWRPFDDAVETVAELVRRGTTVAVASNFDARLHAVIAEHFPQVRREHVFVSSELGRRKPSRQFFDACRTRLASAKPTLIGDDLENDLYGAQQAQWHALLIDREGRYADVPSSQRIQSLRELL